MTALLEPTYPEFDKEEPLLWSLLKDVPQTTTLSRELVRNVTDVNRLQVNTHTQLLVQWFSHLCKCHNCV